ncbi:hypothetical protein EB001_20130 [bacterium]|jgi:hypothetical protein|nr:hypothetical protein [bacterium]
MEHSLVTLSNTSATKLTPNGKHSGMDITLQNVNDSGYIYIGGEGVTSSNYGFRIMPNHSFSIELNGNDAIYAISSSNGLSLAVLKARLEVGS